MKSGYKIFLALFVAVFFAVSIIPLLAIDTKSEFSKENRKLAIFPQEFNTNFPKGFEKYLNDRFGFRSEFVRTYKKVLYYWFKVSTASLIVVGKDGHVFHREKFSEAAYVKHKEKFFRLEEECNKLNFHAPIFFLTVPTPYLIKKEFLPEYVTMQYEKVLSDPWRYIVQNNGERGLSMQFIDKHVLYPYDEAMFLNSYRDIYPDKNWHWVAKSPYPDMVAAMVFEKIAKYYGDVAEKPVLDLSLYGVPCEKYSDIDHLVGFDIKNNMFLCRHPDKHVKRVSFDKHYNVEEHRKNIRQFGFLINEKPLTDKKLLILGDSFVVGISDSLASYFKEVMVVQITALKNYDLIVPLINEYYDFDVVLMVSNKHELRFPVDLFERLKK